MVLLEKKETADYIYPPLKQGHMQMCKAVYSRVVTVTSFSLFMAVVPEYTTLFISFFDLNLALKVDNIENKPDLIRIIILQQRES